MTNIYAGAPDARQAGEITPSRFRPRYRALTEAEKTLHDEIKAKAAELEALIDRARDLRFPPVTATSVPLEQIQSGAIAAELVTFDPAVEYFADGMKSLELAVMWTVKGLTA